MYSQPVLEGEGVQLQVVPFQLVSRNVPEYVQCIGVYVALRTCGASSAGAG